jgi:hypothetical protein
VNRRTFLKFLGIGSATAVVAPSVALAAIDTPVTPAPITYEMLQAAMAQVTVQPNLAQGRYMYVQLAKTSMPIKAGDFLYHKRIHYKYHGRRESRVIAYKTKKLRAEPLAIAISVIPPGYFGWVLIASQAGDFAAKEFNPETGCYPLNHFSTNCFEGQA